MPFIQTDFPGLLVFEPLVYKDARGYFFESYNEKIFNEGGANMKFVQDNQAKSSYGVIRGLHFQHPPYTQTKLIRALSGSILDVVVDLRVGSPTHGKVYSIELTEDNQRQLLVPKGFAHGYSVLSETAVVLYKCDEFYHPKSEGGVLFCDPALAIDWKIPADKALVADKDQQYPTFADCQHQFVFEG